MLTNNNTSSNRTFAAISDPTRRQILDHLRVGELCAGEIAGHFPITRPAIARHVQILKKAGLVKERKDAQRRIYSLSIDAFDDIDRWLQSHRVFWAARLTDLKSVIEQQTVKQAKSDDMRGPK